MAKREKFGAGRLPGTGLGSLSDAKIRKSASADDIVCGIIKASTGCDGVITGLKNAATRPQALREVKSLLRESGNL